MKKNLNILLTLVLICGVGYAVYRSVNDKLGAGSIRTLKGLIGSEKEDFFRDSSVVEALRRQGLAVEVEKAGSRQISSRFDPKVYDFAFPSGYPAAENLRQTLGKSKSYDVFYTPMVFASWKPIAEILAANGMVRDRGGYYSLDFKALLQAMVEGRRWKDLKGNSAFAINKRILVTTTDIRKSNSAAMFLAMASFVANGDGVVQSDSEMVRILPQMEALFLNQGFSEYSSEAPFEDYLVMGMGKSPLVLIYESQFLSRAGRPGGGISKDMVLIYPEPTLFTKHILVPATPEGEKLGGLLQDDSALQDLAVRHGFRTRDAARFQAAVASRGLQVPLSLVDVVEPPGFGMLEKMIVAIEKKYP